MIAHIQGRLVEKSPTQIVIDCGGVGYLINISLHTYSQLPESENVKVYRNIQDLLKEMNKRDEDNARIDKQFRSLRITNVFLMLLSILNVGAVSVIILFLLGVLH